jgi:hypothetical protein
MAIDWTDEKLAALTMSELEQLAINAEAMGRAEIGEACRRMIEARKPKRVIPARLPSDFVPVARSAVARKLEQEVVALLKETAIKLLARYDFGKEKARALSEGFVGFVAHSFLDQRDNPKTGRAQKQGRVHFDRYVSYRLRDEVYALVAILFEGEEMTGVRYQVLGPERLLTNYLPIADIRPYLLDDEGIGTASGGEEFSTYRAAAERFEWLIEQVAPKL